MAAPLWPRPGATPCATASNPCGHNITAELVSRAVPAQPPAAASTFLSCKSTPCWPSLCYIPWGFLCCYWRHRRSCPPASHLPTGPSQPSPLVAAQPRERVSQVVAAAGESVRRISVTRSKSSRSSSPAPMGVGGPTGACNPCINQVMPCVPLLPQTKTQRARAPHAPCISQFYGKPPGTPGSQSFKATTAD